MAEKAFDFAQRRLRAVPGLEFGDLLVVTQARCLTQAEPTSGYPIEFLLGVVPKTQNRMPKSMGYHIVLD